MPLILEKQSVVRTYIALGVNKSIHQEGLCMRTLASYKPDAQAFQEK